MRRFLLVLFFGFFLVAPSLAENIYPDIPENATLYYSVYDKKWSATPSSNTIKLVKHYTLGANKFSEYVIGELRFDANSTKEFLFKGDLIGYNKNTLKFHRLYFENETLKEETLNEKELKELFPDYEIIRISQFKDNSIKLKRNPFNPKTYLIMNDTNTMFYNYRLKGVDNTFEEFNCVFTPKFNNGKIEFSTSNKSVTYTPYYIRFKYVL